LKFVFHIYLFLHDILNASYYCAKSAVSTHGLKWNIFSHLL